MGAAGAAIVAVGADPWVVLAVVGEVAVGAVGAAGVEGGVEEEEQQDVVGRGSLLCADVFRVQCCGVWKIDGVDPATHTHTTFNHPDTGTHIGEPQVERPHHEGEKDVDVQDEGERNEERRAAREGVEAAHEGRVEEAFVLFNLFFGVIYRIEGRNEPSIHFFKEDFFGFGFGFGCVWSLVRAVLVLVLILVGCCRWVLVGLICVYVCVWHSDETMPPSPLTHTRLDVRIVT